MTDPDKHTFSDDSEEYVAGPIEHFRTIFISDTHLGTKGCQAERLLHFLQSRSCDQLYLVGDIIDGWQLKSSSYWPQSHTNVIVEILDQMASGTEVIYVTGNHDEFLRRYSKLIIGNLKLVDEEVHEAADGRRLLVQHGDQFDVVTLHHKWVAKLGGVGYSILLTIGRWLNWWRERFGFGYWSLADWAKKKVKKAVNRASDFEAVVARECRINKYDGVVCGHIHHAEYRRLEDVDYYNCGDWVDSCTALLEDYDGTITVFKDVVEETPTKPRRVRRRRARLINGSTRRRTRKAKEEF